MDRNMNYTVDVNIMAGGQWGISKLVTFDATWVSAFLPYGLRYL